MEKQIYFTSRKTRKNKVNKIDSKTHIVLPLSIIFFAALLYWPIFGSFSEEDIIPVSSGASLTVYEQTGSIYEYTYPVVSLLAGGGEFVTGAGEKYNISSDGTYLTVHCFHHKSVLDGVEEFYEGGKLSSLPYRKELGCRPGNNIVAVKLNGIPGFPDGLWASTVISYSLGENGNADAKINTLGDAIIDGDDEGKYCASFGEGHSNVVLGFSPLIRATVSLIPETLEPESEIVTIYIELSQGHSVEDIDFSTVTIVEVADNQVNILPVVWSRAIIDHDNDGVSDLRLEFYRNDLVELFYPGNNTLTIAGRMYGGVSFRGAGVVAMKGISP